MDDSRDNSIRFGDICMENLPTEFTSSPGSLISVCYQDCHLFCCNVVPMPSRQTSSSFTPPPQLMAGGDSR